MRPTRYVFIGTIVLLIYMFVYALLVMAFAASRINGSAYEGVFYLVAGFAWLPLAMVIVKYMAKGNMAKGKKP